MFDIGFSEVLLIFVIALVVLGPEKLPRVASQVGRWIGRARAMARQFREQLEEEVNLEQVRKAHREEAQKRLPRAAAHGHRPRGAARAASARASAERSTNPRIAGHAAGPAPGCGTAVWHHALPRPGSGGFPG